MLLRTTLIANTYYSNIYKFDCSELLNNSHLGMQYKFHIVQIKIDS